MKKYYSGLKAEKIDLSINDTIATSDNCIQIVANLLNGTSTCQNPPSTISYMWVNDNPGGWT